MCNFFLLHFCLAQPHRSSKSIFRLHVANRNSVCCTKNWHCECAASVACVYIDGFWFTSWHNGMLTFECEQYKYYVVVVCEANGIKCTHRGYWDDLFVFMCTTTWWEVFKFCIDRVFLYKCHLFIWKDLFFIYLIINLQCNTVDNWTYW